MKRKLRAAAGNLAKKFPALRRVGRVVLYHLEKLKFLRCAAFAKVNPKQVIFEVFAGQLYCDSPRVIYERMQANEAFKDYRFVWAFVDPQSKEHYFKNAKNTMLVNSKSPQYYKAMAESGYIIVNFMLALGIRKRKGQTYVQTWHGTPLKKIRYDIIAEGAVTHSNDEVRFSNDLDAVRYDKFIAPSPFFIESYLGAFNLKKLGKDDIFLKTGYPRNDYLFSFTEDEVSARKKLFGIPENKKVILYAPTFRDNQHKSGQGYVYSLGIDFDMLREAIGEDYVILFRTHYLVTNSFDFERFEGFIFDASAYEDISELYPMADVLITDYSSVFFDFANLKRPIIWYMYDLELYRDELRGFYFDISLLPGPIVTTQAELTSQLTTLPDYFDRYEEKYKAFNQMFNPWDDKDSGIRALEQIFNS